MRSFILSAQAELAARGALGVITVPAPALDAAALAGAVAPLVYWEAPDPEADGRLWTFVGWGEAARLEAEGEGAHEPLMREAARLFGQAVERRHPELELAPAPRLFGGFAFRPESKRSEPWTEFGDMSFVMPRWLYGTRGDLAFLRLALGEGEALSSAEIDAVLGALAPFEARAAKPPAAAPAVLSAHHARIERAAPSAWIAMVEDALAQIRTGALHKVVPASICRVHAEQPFDVGAALARLGASYPECTRFAVQRGRAVLLGASPERLVSRRGLEARVDALAGSIPRRGEDDDARAAALLGSDKDLREHRAVVEAIEGALKPLARDLTVPEAPRLRALRNVYHLWTPIEARLSRPTHVLELARVLHPTPAVCGTPREEARAFIAAHEPISRGWYAGAVGWFDAAGDGAFTVAIRSGVILDDHAFLYVGAGIVEGSDPGLEYAEIRAKEAPMLAALGLGA